MDTTSASNVLPTDVVLSCIDTSIRNLYELRNIILQREETLPQGTPVDEKQHQQRKVRHIHYSVVDQIKVLEKVFKNVFQLDQTMEDADPDASFAQQGRTVVEADPAVPMLVSNPAETKESTGQFKGEISRNENETKEPRYLYLSDGLVICCLELKHRKHQPYNDINDVPPLPKIATLKLLDVGFPVSAGLFKLGSDAYMIGGQLLPPLNLDSSIIEFKHCKPCGAELYEYIADKHKFRGSSCVTYRLSRDEGGILSLQISDDIRELNDPKIWPVIEKIDGRLHVIDSIPRIYPKFMAAETGTFSHEVLNPDELGQGWIRIPTTDAIGEGEIVCSHLAVGNRIYSTTSDNYMMFDSTTNKWEARPKQKEREPPHPFCVEHVLHILKFGNGRCVGKFLPSDDPLFIVIALVQNMATYDLSPHVVAYLVSPTGRVLCFQRLPRFFEHSCDGCFRPQLYRDGTVIRVDEQGEMMCAIVNARTWGKFKGYYLYINMFTVEGLDDSASKVGEILNDAAGTVAVELEFVRVVIKERYVFETVSDADISTFSRVQACFI